jgi:hypothetical protein
MQRTATTRASTTGFKDSKKQLNESSKFNS